MKYFGFVKWYYNYIGNELFDNTPGWRVIRRKDRLPTIIMAYIMMIFSLLLFSQAPFKKALFYGFMLMLGSIMFLFGCNFSFLSYFIAYIRSNNKDKSINDYILFKYGVLNGGKSELLSMMSKYFNVYISGGNAFAVKITLLAKGRTLRKKTAHIKKVLKITPNKIYLNRNVIFDKKMLDMSDLERFLIEEANNWN